MEIKTSCDGINSLRIDGNGISFGPVEKLQPCSVDWAPQKSGNKLRTNPFKPYLFY